MFQKQVRCLKKQTHATNMPFLCPRHFQWGRGVHIVSSVSVHTSILSIRPVRNTNGFRAISFETIVVLD